MKNLAHKMSPLSSRRTEAGAYRNRANTAEQLMGKLQVAGRSFNQERCENLISKTEATETKMAPTLATRAVATNKRKTRREAAMFQSTRIVHLSISTLLSIIPLLIAILSIRPTLGQCPWTRESAELHADCICDFNPSQPASLTPEQQSLELQRPVNRMSVQCAPVDFGLLLEALKQTASVELPSELLQANNETTTTTTTTAHDQQSRAAAAMQLASQAKLDLLHVGNSSIKLLADDMFILDTTKHRAANTSGALDSRHLVVAIQSLHLSRCGIETIRARAFAGLEWSLTSLSLSDNQLELVPSEAINRLFNLKVLDLSNNRISHLAPQSFARLNKLTALRLADNRIGGHSASAQVDLGAFDGLEETLSDLNLKNTQLDQFPVAIARLKSLAFLNLAQNQISRVPARSFSNMNSLTAINLERNRISRIEEETFLGVESSLSSLSLLGNLLDSFPASQLSKLVALRRLDIGFNEIDSLPANAFLGNKQLILVALDGNPLETLPELAFKSLEGTLRGMSIGGKALNCDCRLSWMLRWQQEHNLQISSRERQPQFCAKPHYLRSLVSFAALKPEHLTCTSRETTTLAPPMANSTSWPTTKSGESHTPTPEVPTTTTRRLAMVPTLWSVIAPSTLATSNATIGPSEPETSANVSVAVGATSVAPKQTETSTMALLGNELTDPDYESTGGPSGGGGGGEDEFVPASTEMSLLEDQEPTSSSISLDFIAPPTATRPTVITSQFANGVNKSSPAAQSQSSQGSSFRRIISNGPAAETDGLLVGDPDSQRKLNRNGFHWPTPRSKASELGDDEQIRRNATILIDQAIQSIHAADVQRRTRTKLKAGQTATGSPRPGPSQASKPKPVHSVFGSRAATTTTTPEPMQVNASSQWRANRRVAEQQMQGYENNPIIMPAVPTTINVYKTMPIKHNQTLNLSTTNTLFKNPRFVEESMAIASQIDWSKLTTTSTTTTTTSTTPAPTLPVATKLPGFRRSSSAWPPTTGSSTERHFRIDSDIERYTVAASDIQSRFQATIAGSGALQTTTRPLPMGHFNVELQRVTESPATLVTSAPSTTTTSTTTEIPERLHTNTSPPNNTRMSVSSMYRLANGSQKTTTPTAAAVASSGSSLLTTRSQQEAIVYSQPISTLRTYSPATGAITTMQMAPTTSSLPEAASTRMATTVRIVDSLPGRPKLQSVEFAPHLTMQPRTLSASATSSSTTTTTTTTSTSTTTTTTTTTPSPSTERDDGSSHQARGQSTVPMGSTIVEVVVPLTTTTTSATTLTERIHHLQPQTKPTSAATTTANSLLTTRNFSPPGPNHRVELPTTTSVGITMVGSNDERQQIDQSVDLSDNSATSSRPTQMVVANTSTKSPRSAHATQSDILITKDSPGQTTRRQSRDEATAVSSSEGARFLQSKLLGKILRLEDTDQLALILAGILCMFILMLALTTACVCYTTSRSGSSLSSNQTSASILSSLSSAENQTGANGCGPTRARKSNCLLRFLCCCFGSKFGGRNQRVTPMRSLILQDDDNSSGSGSSQGLKSTGKSMLIANSSASSSSQLASTSQEMLFESIRNASLKLDKKSVKSQRSNAMDNKRLYQTTTTKQKGGKKKTTNYAFDLEQHVYSGDSHMKPIDHEASILRHKQARALDRECSKARTCAKPPAHPAAMGANRFQQVGSTFTPSGAHLLNISKRRPDAEDDWVRDEDTPVSSCDSDKSCSPSANKNNRYNIGEAHRAYLATGKATKVLPVRASRFVQTTPAHAGSDLLATVDGSGGNGSVMARSQQQLRLSHQRDYLDCMSSDKSTTDDSRTPLARPGARRHEYRTQNWRQQAVESFHDRQQLTRSRSICRLPAGVAPMDSLINNNAADSQMEPGEFFHSDLIPMSAEEEWPEPYVDPADGQQVGGSLISGKERQHVHYRPSMVGHLHGQRSHQAHHRRTNSGFELEANQQSSWQSAGRGNRQQQQQQVPMMAPQNNRQHQFQLQPQQHQPQFHAPGTATLARFRSDPSLDDGGGSNQLFHFGGATNWLRWTPHPSDAEQQGKLHQQQQHPNGNQHGPLDYLARTGGMSRPTTTNTSLTSAWHQDNQVDSLYVAQTSNHQ